MSLTNRELSTKRTPFWRLRWRVAMLILGMPYRDMELSQRRP